MKEEKRGGKREGAGRKPKIEEQQLVEKLSPMDDTVLDVLKDNISSGEKWAIELYFKFRYGMPKQVIDQKTELTFPKIDMNDWR